LSKVERRERLWNSPAVDGVISRLKDVEEEVESSKVGDDSDIAMLMPCLRYAIGSRLPGPGIHNGDPRLLARKLMVIYFVVCPWGWNSNFSVPCFVSKHFTGDGTTYE